MKLQLGHHHPIRSTQLDYEQRKKLGRKAKNKSPPRRKILAERIVEEEKRQREAHLLRMDQYKNSIRSNHT